MNLKYSTEEMITCCAQFLLMSAGDKVFVLAFSNERGAMETRSLTGATEFLKNEHELKAILIAMNGTHDEVARLLEFAEKLQKERNENSSKTQGQKS